MALQRKRRNNSEKRHSSRQNKTNPTRRNGRRGAAALGGFAIWKTKRKKGPRVWGKNERMVRHREGEERESRDLGGNKGNGSGQRINGGG